MLYSGGGGGGGYDLSFCHLLPEQIPTDCYTKYMCMCHIHVCNHNYVVENNFPLFLEAEACVLFLCFSNLVPRVLRLFGQRGGARRDSGIMEKYNFFDWSSA